MRRARGRGDDPRGRERPARDPLARLKRRLAAFVLVAQTAVATAAAAAAFVVAVLAVLRVVPAAPLGWIVVLGAGGTGVKLLGFVYRRLTEPGIDA
ncbi:MAG TPA: hypothetical protein VHN37_06275 [Actinomycetota bacterium]|nr:hypothetical protein [Actinomycetota bacterium]